MKSTNLLLTQKRAYIKDNREYISGNVAEHLLDNVYNDDNVSFFSYLTDEEIEEMNGNVAMWERFEEEVKEFINEYFDYDISEFEY